MAADTIKRLRMAAGFDSNAELADAAGVNQATVSRLSTGGQVGVAVGVKLAQALGVSYDELRDAFPGQIPGLGEKRQYVRKEAA